MSDPLWIESSCGIAEGVCVGIAEADADGVLKEASATIETGIEAACGLGPDPLEAEEIGFGVEWEAPAERHEGSGGEVNSLPGEEGEAEIEEALTRCGDDLAAALGELEVSLRGLKRRMIAHGLDRY